MLARSSEEASDAFFKDDYFVFDASLSRFALEQLQGFFDRFVREAESSIVHGDHPLGIQIQKRFGGIGWAGVDIAELLGIVSADGEQSQIGRQAASDFAKAVKVGGVSGVVDGVLAGAQNIAAIASMRIF